MCCTTNSFTVSALHGSFLNDQAFCLLETSLHLQTAREVVRHSSCLASHWEGLNLHLLLVCLHHGGRDIVQEEVFDAKELKQPHEHLVSQGSVKSVSNILLAKTFLVPIWCHRVSQAKWHTWDHLLPLMLYYAIPAVQACTRDITTASVWLSIILRHEVLTYTWLHVASQASACMLVL